MNTFQSIILAVIAGVLVLLASCGDPDPSKAPVINTPSGAKVNLDQVTLEVTNAKLTMINPNKYRLNFDYTITNNAGGNIVFPCLYNTTDDLIDVNLTDKDGYSLHLGKRPLGGLTLPEPRPLRIPVGKTTRSYQVPVMPELREEGDPINLRVRLHAPSRYDELRSTIAAPHLQLPWPAN
ncbi:MAG: hypothetical protein KJO79_01445 [Verrucomicrobiae bacterium]|nr:hypothetical protein [Verrucomicrobiae bacterium]NNJ85812.1 hypothetical protein [Akkermansiaceae bacterium]